MSFILDGTTIPNPKEFGREFINVAQDCETVSGKTGRDTRLITKEKYTLAWETLTTSEVAALLTIADKGTPVSFVVNDDDLIIPQVNVIVRLESVEYTVAGSSYLASLSLDLEEVE